MKLDITTLDGAGAGSVELDEAIFGLEPRPDLLQRMVRWQLAKRRAGTHAVQEPLGREPDPQEALQAEGHRQRPSRRGLRSAVPRRRPGLRPGGARPRHDLPKKVRALALKHALSAKAKTSTLIVVDDVKLADGKTKALAERFGKLGLSSALIIGGAEVDVNFGRAAPQPAADRRPAGAGHQRLRHPASREARSHPRSRRCAGGAFQMSADPAPLRRDRLSGHHREGDEPDRAEQGRVQRRAEGDEAADQGSGREAVRRQGDQRQHARPKGKRRSSADGADSVRT